MRKLVALLASVLIPMALSVSTSAAADDPSSCGGSISSNFNGTSIAAGNSVWFNSVATVKGAVDGTQLTLGDSQAVFTASGITYTVPMPTSIISFSSGATSSTTDFDADQNAWVTTVPVSYAGNLFLSGAPFLVPAGGLPGGINPVVWSWSLSSNTPGVSLQWKWGAAVYRQFPTDLASIGVKPVDGSSANPYQNSDHAGTPENIKKLVTGGARGGGGSNFTGSYSGTEAVTWCTPSVSGPPL